MKYFSLLRCGVESSENASGRGKCLNPVLDSSKIQSGFSLEISEVAFGENKSRTNSSPSHAGSGAGVLKGKLDLAPNNPRRINTLTLTGSGWAESLTISTLFALYCNPEQ